MYLVTSPLNRLVILFQKYWKFGIFTVLCIYIGCSLFVSFFSTHKAPTEKKIAVIEQTLKYNPSLKKDIREIHEAFNECICNSKYKHPDWNQLIPFTREMDDTIQNQLLQEISSANLKTDLITASSLIEYAAAHKDINSLVKVHRILHDLDSHLINADLAENKSKDYWGVTLTIEGKSKYAFHQPN